MQSASVSCVRPNEEPQAKTLQRTTLFLANVNFLYHDIAGLRALQFSAMFLRHLVRWPSVDIQVKFYGDRLRGTPASGELNTRGVTEYSDFGPIERYISETVQTEAKSVSITNRKSHISFRLVPNSVTLDDLERRHSHNRSVIAPNSVGFGTDYVKVVEDTPILSGTEM